jgi:glycosyltransferase involved in cell wall biosynthesis
VIYGGIDPEPFFGRPARSHFENGTVRLLYFGSLLPQKGVRTAVEALGHLHRQGEGDGVTLTLLGGGHPDYEAELRTIAAEQRVEDCVTFAGRINRSQIPEWLPNYDVFLFTSTWPEPFGRTIVEAMAAGLVVIGATVGGSREIFEHYAPDLLFQPGDAKTLAVYIGRIRHDRQRQRELVECGRRVVCNHFTLERMAMELEEWFTQIAP